jgi:flagellar hook-associated protein 3 FlgL
MTISSISSQYLGTAMLPAVTQAQSQLTTLEVESTTGQYADLGLQLGSQSGYELSLKNQYDQMQSLTTDNAIATTNLSAAQAALDSIRSGAQTTLQSLTALTGVSDAASTLQTLGSTSLQALIGSANASSGDQYVFGGINSSTPPLTSYFSAPPSNAQNAVDQAFQSFFGFSTSSPSSLISTITPAQMQTFLTDPTSPFAAEFAQGVGGNWNLNWSSASSTDTSAEIAPGETIATSTNANQPGFPQLVQAYTMLNEFGGLALSQSTQQVLVTTASSLVSQGVSSMTTTEAQVGSSLGQITQANAAMSSQMSILQTQVGNLDDVDANSVATQLNTLTTQIETAYQLTAQLQKLSLAQYLPV